MPAHPLKMAARTIGKAVFDVGRWTAVGTLLGATGGAAFGAIYGILDLFIYGEPWRILSSGAYLALCGAAAGALVGAFGTIFEWGEAPLRARTGLRPRITTYETRIVCIDLKRSLCDEPGILATRHDLPRLGDSGLDVRLRGRL